MRYYLASGVVAVALIVVMVVRSQPVTKINPAQVGAQVAFFNTDFFDLRANPEEKNAFNLTGVPALPTLATVAVYVDGRLLAEGIDYNVVQGTPWQIQTQAMYKGNVIQIRYYKGQ